MISLEAVQATSRSVDPISSPRISFSADLLELDEEDFISITPNTQFDKEQEKRRERARNVEFEFLSSSSQKMLSADELFFDGKLLPFWQMHESEKLKKISLKTEQLEEAAKKQVNKVESRESWFVDDDPSPRPPKCTVLWKELLRLKKQRSTLSPSSSSSSSSSSSRALDLSLIEEGKEGPGKKEKHVKRIKKGLERTRSASIKIRPVVNVPICTHGKSNALPPLFSKKSKPEK